MGTKSFFVTVLLIFSTLSPSGKSLSQDTTVPATHNTKTQVIIANKNVQQKSEQLTKSLEELKKESEKASDNVAKAEALKADALQQRAVINKIIVEKELLAKKTMRTPIEIEPTQLPVGLVGPIISPDSVRVQDNISFFKKVFRIFKK